MDEQRETKQGSPDEILGSDTEEYYIPATSSFFERRPRILKHNETFAVLDHYGNASGRGRNPEGLFHADMRFLSRLDLRIEGQIPLLLGSTIADDNTSLIVDLTNPDIFADGEIVMKRDTLHIFRTMFLWRDAAYEQLRIDNFSHQRQSFSITLSFDADFKDIFEVRGMERERRGERSSRTVSNGNIEFVYMGLDEVRRVTQLMFEPAPDRLDVHSARFKLTVEPQKPVHIFMGVFCQSAPADDPMEGLYRSARKQLDQHLESTRSSACRLSSSNELFDAWINRSLPDLQILCTDVDEGLYPYAGIPWYSAAFGRDAIITALQTLWVQPSLARGVLDHLAATQATDMDPLRDAEPGKILHEARRGEMARLGEVPFRAYYGTADATPLFIVLAHAYYHRTADKAYAERLWPHIEAALTWITQHGDSDRDGFVEYERADEHGLQNQGWKDSVDSVFHADGNLAKGPIALCEVQAYVYAAFLGAADLAKVLNIADRATELRRRAEDLQARFEQTFWCEDIGTYGLALDGAKRLCRVRTSNAGHTLATGIASDDNAHRVAEALMSEHGFSGWGIRTVSVGESLYNPASYHNGSVWPHDNAIIAAGFARYGMKEHAMAVFRGMFDVAMCMDLYRLPELFCGFHRRAGHGPTFYPVACIPQAWASATVFGLIGTALGVEFNPDLRQIIFRRPELPPFLSSFRIEGLRVGDGEADIVFERYDGKVAMYVAETRGKVHVICEH